MSATCRCCGPTPTATSFPTRIGYPAGHHRHRRRRHSEHRGRRRRRRAYHASRRSGHRRPDDVLAVRTGHAFLADIAHDAVPVGKLADGDITIGLANPGNGDTEYDNELLDAHFIAGDGRVNENIGLTAVHHVFHSEHNRLVEHTKDARSWRRGDLRLPQRMAGRRRRRAAGATPAAIAGRSSGTASACSRPPSSAPRCSTSTSCSRSSPARSSRTIDVFLVPDGFDTTINPTIVAEFAHVVYRFGHSMLTESIDRFDPDLHRGPHRPDRGLPQPGRVRRRPRASTTTSPPAPSSAA